MKRRFLAVITSMVLIMITLACQLITGRMLSSPTATPEPVEIPVIIEDTATPEVDNSIAETQAAAEENVQATMDSAQATVDAVNQAIEETSAAVDATIAAAEAQVLTETAQVDTRATAQAQDFANVLDGLAKEGFLERTAGTYGTIEDFNENWAQIGWYQWWNTGYQPTNFVVRAHTEWESASRTANWFDSGCGFVFRSEDEDNHYMIFLALDGNVYLKGYVDGVYKEFGKGYVGKIDNMKGEADVMLVAEGNRILYFVDGEKILDRQNDLIETGDLALTLVSGTNKDFGTRCSITNIELWDLGE